MLRRSLYGAKTLNEMSSGVKRSSTATSTSSPPKKKLHAFFTGQPSQLGKFIPSPPSVIHFLHLDPFARAQLSVSESPETKVSPNTVTTSAAVVTDRGGSRPTLEEQPQAEGSRRRVPVVLYDLDGTLIKTKSGKKFPSSREDWAWWHPSVPSRLRTEWENGRHLIAISNQGDSRPKIRTEWRAKLPLIAAKMPADVPLRIIAALDKYDKYRKPRTGMFDIIQQVYRDQGLEIDLPKSVFVGDAAGRLAGPRGQQQDHGDTDFKFALNVGIDFLTPEEYFLGDPKPVYPNPPNGFHSSKIASLATLPLIVPSHTPIARDDLEIVLFVGSPASGKSSFYRKHFASKYHHVNQDTLKTRDRCILAADDCLTNGKSVVVDNTNRNSATRAHWISLAVKHKIPIRAFHFTCPLDLARHNNVYRACYAPSDEPKREWLPLTAFASFQADFEPPTVDEGFDEIRAVNFKFKGTEEQRKKWDMWLLDK